MAPILHPGYVGKTKKVREYKPVHDFTLKLGERNLLHPEAAGSEAVCSAASVGQGMVLESCKYKFWLCISRSVHLGQSCGIVLRITVVC